MKKILRKTSIKLKYVALLLIFAANLIASAVPVRADVVSDLFRSDPDLPQSLNSEVGWWVTRSKIALFDNTLPSNSADYDKSPPKAGSASTWSVIDQGTIKLGDQEIGPFNTPVHAGHGNATLKYTKSGEEESCSLTVVFSGPSSKPSTGTLSNACDNTDKTVDLKKTNNARIDGWFTKQDDDKEINLFSYLTGLTNCNGVSDIKVGSYAHTGKFTKERNIKPDKGISSAGISVEYKGPNSHTYLDIGKNDSGLVTMEQYAGCGHNQNNYTRYGDTDNDDVSQGRGIFISKTPYETIVANTSDSLKDFHEAKAKYFAFVKFFQKTEKYDEQGNVSASGTTNAKAAENCYNLNYKSGGVGGGPIPYAILTLSTGINGPFNDCLRKFLTPRPGFADIDSIASADLAFPPDNDPADGCSVDIPIIGDLVCGLIKLIYNGVATLFENALAYFGDTADTFKKLNENNGLKQAWASVRNLANIIFLFSFLIVIFQYITDINVVDAYFVKKFIPKLIVAVVLVQASFWTVGEMNNFATALGQSVQSLILFSANLGTSAQISTGTGAVADLTAGAGAFGLFGAGSFIIALVMGLLALIALLISIILLTIREILLVLLAMLAPLAFACIAIPQLEGTFKKWLTMYVKLLMVYPIMMLFLAIGNIVGQAFSDPSMNPIYQFMGFIAYFLPFILLPFTFKMAGGVMGNIAAKINNAAVNKGKGTYQNSQFARKRQIGKDTKEGIRKGRAQSSWSQRTGEKLNKAEENRTSSNKFNKARGTFAQKRMFGVTSTERDAVKFGGALQDAENKRQSDEATAALNSRVSKMGSRDEVVKHLRASYETAMDSGDGHAASAAYTALVGQRDTSGLEAIQEKANSGGYGDEGTARYNRQQGANYGDLTAFAPHLRGDVGGVDLNTERAANLRGLSNDQIAGIKPESWGAWAKTSPAGAEEAARKYNAVLRGGGGAASKLAPDAREKILASNMDKDGNILDRARHASLVSLLDAPPPP